MFRRFGYPISDRLKKEMWILDFGLDDFARVGMAGIFWLNRQDHNYFGHEIYLLPGQMIPEHKHLATDKGGAKMESWQPRHGMIYTFGDGEPTPELLDKIPPSQRDLVKSRHCKPLGIDEVGDLNELDGLALHGGRSGRGSGDRVRHVPRHGRTPILESQSDTLTKELLMADLSLFDLTGKKALVTGGAMGIGRGCAVALARAGADVAIVDLNDKAGSKTADEIRSMGVAQPVRRVRRHPEGPGPSDGRPGRASSLGVWTSPSTTPASGFWEAMKKSTRPTGTRSSR